MKYGYLQDAITNQDVWLRKEVGTKNNVADGLTKTMNQHVLRNMLTTLKIELLETSKEQLSINLIVCKNNLMGAEDSDAGRGVNPSTGHKKILMRSWTRRRASSLGCQSKFLQQEHREGWPRKLVQEHREGWPRKLAQEHRE